VEDGREWIGDCYAVMNLSNKNLTFQLLIFRFLIKTPSFSLPFYQNHPCPQLQSLYSCTRRKGELRDVHRQGYTSSTLSPQAHMWMH